MEISDRTRDEGICDTVISLAPYIEICHHIPGRIRLKISPLALTLIDKADIARTIHAIPGVMHQRMSPHARSIVIEYDRKRIPFDLWELLGQIKEKPELAAVAASLMRFLWHGEKVGEVLPPPPAARKRSLHQRFTVHIQGHKGVPEN
jgi:hypothetical protein